MIRFFVPEKHPNTLAVEVSAEDYNDWLAFRWALGKRFRDQFKITKGTARNGTREIRVQFDSRAKREAAMEQLKVYVS